jgi:predicted Abi (CAAX) family protease
MLFKLGALGSAEPDVGVVAAAAGITEIGVVPIDALLQARMLRLVRTLPEAAGSVLAVGAVVDLSGAKFVGGRSGTKFRG